MFPAPYTNTHELNLDWVLQVVHDFQTKYTNFDDDVTAALAAIEAAKNGSIGELHAALNVAINAVNSALEAAQAAITADKTAAQVTIANDLASAEAAIAEDKTNAQTAIAEDKTGALASIADSLETALTNLDTNTQNVLNLLNQFLIAAEQELAQRELEVTGRISALYNTLPADSTDILGQLAIIDGILTGASVQSLVWLQGQYLNNDTVITADSNHVSSQIIGGTAGRRLVIHCETGYQINEVGVWRYVDNVLTHGGWYPQSADFDEIIPPITVYLSIQITKTDYSNLTPSDIPGNVSVDWPVNTLQVPSMIAYIEQTSTASIAHIVGEASQYFIYNGTLYQATDDIPQYGNIVTSGTGQNCINITDGICKIISEIDSGAYQPGTTVNINTSNYSQFFTDANSAPNNRSYFIESSITNQMISNLPAYGFGMMLFTFGTLKNSSNGSLQFCYETYHKYLYYRHKTTAWGTWTSVDNIAQAAAASAASLAYQPAISDSITSSNYSTYFSNADDALNNRSYFIQNTITDQMISNLPAYGNHLILITFGSLKNASSGRLQIANDMSTNKLYYRRKTTTWGPWITVQTNQDAVPYLRANIAIIGDSYSTMRNYIPTGNAYYYPHTDNNVTALSDTWWAQVISAIKGNLLVSDSYSGSTIANSIYASGQSYVKRIDDRFNAANIDKPKPDLIILFGGQNDDYRNITVGNPVYSDWTASDLEQFAPAFAYCIDALKKWCPFSKLIVIINQNLEADYRTAMSTICTHYDVQHVDISLTQQQLVDNHPNKAGMTAIANAVIAAL